MGSSISPSWYLSAQKPREYINISGILAVYEYWMQKVKKARSIQYGQRTYGHDALERALRALVPSEALEAVESPEMANQEDAELGYTMQLVSQKSKRAIGLQRTSADRTVQTSRTAGLRWVMA